MKLVVSSLARCIAVNGAGPTHYLFPACENERFDLTRLAKELAYGEAFPD